MNPEIKVLITDDHPVFRTGLRQVIEKEAGLRVVAEAEDGHAALAQVRTHAPDVVVLDVDMPGMDGFDVVRALRQDKISVRIIFLTMHKDEDIFNEAMSLDVEGYVLKDSAVTDIVASIKAVAAGQSFISPSVSSYLLNRTRRVNTLVQEKPSLQNLTATERRIIKLISENKTSREIATELFISTRTVENHRANIATKLELRGAHSLLKFALDHKADL